MKVTSAAGSLPPPAPLPTVAADPPVPTDIPELHTNTPGTIPAVRYEAVSDMKALTARYNANRPIIYSMLDPTTRPEERDDIVRDLGILPTELLQAAKDRGVVIYVTRPDEKGPPTRLFHPNTDAQSQAAAWDAYYKNPTGQAPGLMGPVEPRSNAPDMAWPVRPPQDGDTWTDIARLHGAQTPDEVQEFLLVAGHANPGADVAQPLKSGAKVCIPDMYYFEGNRYTADARGALQNLTDHYPNNDTQDGVFNAGFNVLLINEKSLPDPSPLGGHYRTILHEFGHVAYYLIAADPKLGPAYLASLDSIEKTDDQEEQQVQAEVRQDTIKDYGPHPTHQEFEAEDQRIEPTQSPFISGYSMEDEKEHDAEGFEAFWTADRHDGVPHGVFTADGYAQLKQREPGLLHLIADQMNINQP